MRNSDPANLEVDVVGNLGVEVDAVNGPEFGGRAVLGSGFDYEVEVHSGLLVISGPWKAMNGR
jgi:hypothetical protein